MQLTEWNQTFGWHLFTIAHRNYDKMPETEYWKILITDAPKKYEPSYENFKVLMIWAMHEDYQGLLSIYIMRITTIYIYIFFTSVYPALQRSLLNAIDIEKYICRSEKKSVKKLIKFRWNNTWSFIYER